MLPIANERKTAMKKLMVATGCTAMAAIVGCSDTQKSAESIGIIGGDDGPTATWMTTQLPWNRFCNRDFLDYVIPAFSITPGMTMEEVATKLEQTVNTHVANENSPLPMKIRGFKETTISSPPRAMPLITIGIRIYEMP